VANKSERWIDHTGLNLIRIVIGSYFMATALGLIAGVDQSVMFLPVLPESGARLVGTALLFILSVGFMAGVFLRLISLMLALFILCSSVVDHYMHIETLAVSAFWRDLALSCAVLLSYSSFKRREIRNAALILRPKAYLIRSRGRSDSVAPRRVSSQVKPQTRRRQEEQNFDKSLRPLIAPTGPIRRPDTLLTKIEAEKPEQPPALPRQKRAQALPAPGDDEDIDNIFANL